VCRLGHRQITDEPLITLATARRIRMRRPMRRERPHMPQVLRLARAALIAQEGPAAERVIIMGSHRSRPVRPTAMRSLWHPPGHRLGRAPRWPQALRRSPVQGATSLGQEPVLSAAPGRASRSKWRGLALPSSARPVAPAGPPRRAPAREHRHAQWTPSPLSRLRRPRWPAWLPDQPPSPGTTKNNGHGQGDGTSMRDWQAFGPRPQSRLGILAVRNPGRRRVRKTPAAHRSAMRPVPRAARRPARRPPGPTRPAPGRQARPCCRSARRSGRRWSARR
jgi:hypothetical protein